MGSFMLMGAIPPLRTDVLSPLDGIAGKGVLAFPFAAFAIDPFFMFDETGTDPGGGVSFDLVVSSVDSELLNGHHQLPPLTCLFFVLCDLRNFRDLRILYLTRTFTCGYE